MAEKQKDMDFGPFTPEERAYFDSRGEKDIPASPSPEPPTATTEVPAQAPAAPVAAEPAPPAAPPEDQKPPALERKVDAGALAEERNRRKEAEERARNMEMLNARMQERFRVYQEATRSPQQAAKPPPSPDQDIFGAVKHLVNQQKRTTAEIENYKRQIAAQQQMETIGQWARQVQADFARAKPDYYAALQHLHGARKRELTILGLNEAAAEQQVLAEERQLLVEAARQRFNPADMAYKLAQARGYVQKTEQRQNTAASNNGPRLDVIEAGQRQAGTLSTVGGGGVTPEATLQEVVNMPEKEFAAWIAKHPAQFRRLKGASN